MKAVRDISNILHAWAPASLAWQKDNVGLIIGDPDARVRKILVCLDVSQELLDEAEALHVDTIVCHHPPIFHPLKSIVASDQTGAAVLRLIRGEINVIAAHTNADAAQYGLNYHLAQLLGLKNIRPLDSIASSRKMLVAHLVDSPELKSTLATMAHESKLSHLLESSANGHLRFELDASSWSMPRIVQSVKDLAGAALISLNTWTSDVLDRSVGIGAIGELEQAITSEECFERIKHRLGTPMLRTNATHSRTVKRIALCGGAGASLVPLAKAEAADVFITADLTYHAFFESSDDIILIDAGHYETEYVFISAASEVLRKALATETDLEVIETKTRTNPVSYL